MKRWAIVEVMGHRTIVGQISETTFAGETFVQIETPDVTVMSVQLSKVDTVLYAPKSIFSLRFVEEAEALEKIVGHIPAYYGAPTVGLARPALTPISAHDDGEQGEPLGDEPSDDPGFDPLDAELDDLDPSPSTRIIGAPKIECGCIEAGTAKPDCPQCEGSGVTKDDIPF